MLACTASSVASDGLPLVIALRLQGPGLLIASLEDEQSAITAQLNAPDFYKTNPADARRINARYAEIEDLLLDALERWERLEARARGE